MAKARRPESQNLLAQGLSRGRSSMNHSVPLLAKADDRNVPSTSATTAVMSTFGWPGPHHGGRFVHQQPRIENLKASPSSSRANDASLAGFVIGIAMTHREADHRGRNRGPVKSSYIILIEKKDPACSSGRASTVLRHGLPDSSTRQKRIKITYNPACPWKAPASVTMSLLIRYY